MSQMYTFARIKCLWQCAPCSRKTVSKVLRFFQKISVSSVFYVFCMEFVVVHDSYNLYLWIWRLNDKICTKITVFFFCYCSWHLLWCEVMELLKELMQASLLLAPGLELSLFCKFNINLSKFVNVVITWCDLRFWLLEFIQCSSYNLVSNDLLLFGLSFCVYIT